MNTEEPSTQMSATRCSIAENPTYAALTITQKPSWVWDPSTYTAPGATSSLAFSFEDPDGTSTQALLHMRTVYVFGHVATVKCWKTSPPKRTAVKPANTTTTTKTLGSKTPAVGESHLVYDTCPLATTNSGFPQITLSPAVKAGTRSQAP